jgi:PAS domain S-box-containing protein
MTEEERYWLHRDFIIDLLKQLPLYVFWKNKDSVYLGCNDAFAHSLGLACADDIIGKTDYDLPTTKDESDSYRKIDQQVMSSKQPHLNFEEPQTLSNGQKIILLTSKVPLLDKRDNVMGILGIYLDITERKKMEKDLRHAVEKSEAANKAKTVFIANMSHDIRTPISGIISISEMLEKGGDTPKDRDYAHVIHQSSERLLSLLNDILGLISVDEINEDALHLETFSLHDRIEHLEELFSPNTEIKNINFKISIDPSLPKYINSDRIKIDRILINLIGNALKFTDHGYVKLDTKVLSKKEDIATIQFTVSDTGVGMPKDGLKNIFDRFYRIAPSYEGKYTGHGIGLFVVKRFIDLLGGTINVKSELGKGTVFTITLPMKCIDENQVIDIVPYSSYQQMANRANMETVNPISTHTEEDQYKDYSVLFIEDDNIARHTGQHFLKSAGLKVHAVSSGEEAIKTAKAHEFDLIITDIGLPGIDGYEFAVLYRRWEKKTSQKYLPIIGLSAHTTAKSRQEALDVGMNLVLEKPLNEFKIGQILYHSLPNGDATTHETALQRICLNESSLAQQEADLLKLEVYPILDERIGLEAVGVEMLKKLLSFLINETIPIELVNLENAYNNNDWDAIQKIAHKLKGSALYCGTIRMNYASQYLERYCLLKHNSLLLALYQQLISVLNDTRQCINDYLNGKVAQK